MLAVAIVTAFSALVALGVSIKAARYARKMASTDADRRREELAERKRANLRVTDAEGPGPFKSPNRYVVIRNDGPADAEDLVASHPEPVNGGVPWKTFATDLWPRTLHADTEIRWRALLWQGASRDGECRLSWRDGEGEHRDQPRRVRATS